MLTDLQRNASTDAALTDELQRLVDLRRAHPTDALLAAHLIEMTQGDWRIAFEAVSLLRNLVASNLRALALTVALEGKEREEQTTQK